MYVRQQTRTELLSLTLIHAAWSSVHCSPSLSKHHGTVFAVAEAQAEESSLVPAPNASVE